MAERLNLKENLNSVISESGTSTDVTYNIPQPVSGKVSIF